MLSYYFQIECEACRDVAVFLWAPIPAGRGLRRYQYSADSCQLSAIGY